MLKRELNPLKQMVIILTTLFFHCLQLVNIFETFEFFLEGGGAMPCRGLFDTMIINIQDFFMYTRGVY